MNKKYFGNSVNNDCVNVKYTNDSFCCRGDVKGK